MPVGPLLARSPWTLFSAWAAFDRFLGKKPKFYKHFLYHFLKRQSFLFFKFVFFSQELGLSPFITIYQRLYRDILLAKTLRCFIGAMPVKTDRNSYATGLFYDFSLKGVSA
jgi:hypothetical protein